MIIFFIPDRSFVIDKGGILPVFGFRSESGLKGFGKEGGASLLERNASQTSEQDGDDEDGDDQGQDQDLFH